MTLGAGESYWRELCNILTDSERLDTDIFKPIHGPLLLHG